MSQSFENLKTNIRSAIDTKNFVAAKRYSETMLLLYPGSAESYYLNARLKNENDVEPAQADALIAAERAVTIEPNNFTYNYYCGAIYLQYKLYELALPMLRKSTLMEPKAPLSQLCLAECYFEIGKGDRAVTHFRNALRLDETGLNRDMIRYKLAHCLVASGQSQAADALLKRLIKDKGEYYLPALSEVVVSSKEKLDSKIGKLVQAALIERVNSPPDQEILHIVMGRLYERAGNSEKAFEFWTKSREIAKTIKYNLRDHAAELTKAKALYTAELFEKTAGYADPSEAPVFIVGMPRTGTTLTEQIIAAHSQAIGVGELARWNKVRDHFERGFQIGNHVEQLVTNAKNGQLKFLAKELLHIFHVVADRQASRIVEKTPHNFGCLGYFHLICPRAKFIHIRRNPADTFISTDRKSVV